MVSQNPMKNISRYPFWKYGVSGNVFPENHLKDTVWTDWIIMTIDIGVVLQVPPRDWCPVKTSSPLLSRPSLSHPVTVSQARLELWLDWSYTWAELILQTSPDTNMVDSGHLDNPSSLSLPHPLIPPYISLTLAHIFTQSWEFSDLRVLQTRPVRAMAEIVVASVFPSHQLRINEFHFRALSLSLSLYWML